MALVYPWEKRADGNAAPTWLKLQWSGLSTKEAEARKTHSFERGLARKA